MVLIATLFIFSCASTKKKDGAPTGDTAAPAAAEAKSEETPKADAAPAKAAANSAGAAVCKAPGDERQLEVVKPDGGGCEVHYTKFGTDKVVANAQNDISYCEEVFNRIKNRLVEAGFECN
ncbi:MAG: hypothetical protein H6624_02315 [Bdellovibrionaceae bacterium]|nr:hypothetical protein [Pseudobdellovibrionaceae bacterium]